MIDEKEKSIADLYKDLKVEKDEDDYLLAFSDDPRKVALYNKIMSYPNLEQHRAQITMVDCRWCLRENIKDEPIEMDDHENGWRVLRKSKRQWLWITCPGCNYQWALWKMGCGQRWHELRKEA